MLAWFGSVSMRPASQSDQPMQPGLVSAPRGSIDSIASNRVAVQRITSWQQQLELELTLRGRGIGWKLLGGESSDHLFFPRAVAQTLGDNDTYLIMSTPLPSSFHLPNPTAATRHQSHSALGKNKIPQIPLMTNTGSRSPDAAHLNVDLPKSSDSHLFVAVSAGFSYMAGSSLIGSWPASPQDTHHTRRVNASRHSQGLPPILRRLASLNPVITVILNSPPDLNRCCDASCLLTRPDYLTPGSPRNRWPEGSRPADRENSRKACLAHTAKYRNHQISFSAPIWGPFRCSPSEAARRDWNSLENIFLTPCSEHPSLIPVSRNRTACVTHNTHSRAEGSLHHHQIIGGVQPTLPSLTRQIYYSETDLPITNIIRQTQTPTFKAAASQAGSSGAKYTHKLAKCSAFLARAMLLEGCLLKTHPRHSVVRTIDSQAACDGLRHAINAFWVIDITEIPKFAYCIALPWCFGGAYWPFDHAKWKNAMPNGASCLNLMLVLPLPPKLPT
ncbi:uncharacterized protein CLUP02_04449 [Colletotrichum lupini]|uniref:Uncharacterized protein n=1 Tax=Colletotrichum lupini TaxID=145971 RepID=A0A9Q8SL82_9PEZI|nr:uncharacterized protein CLUP02_04449 [Colletotrichum lupini]UQC78970.1 hypothetical protein CLUP02_04449 [Colletotrichum lupini]